MYMYSTCTSVSVLNVVYQVNTVREMTQYTGIEVVLGLAFTTTAFEMN